MSEEDKVLNMQANEFVAEMEEQFPTWFEKLNLVVGLVSLGFAALAFKSEEPELVGWFLFIVVLGVMYSIRHYFPNNLKLLRTKKEKTTLEKVILKGVESQFLGLSKVVVGGFVYWVGLLSLFAVANGFKTTLLTKILPIFTG